MIFVAEIGSNHKGIKSLAFEMIRQAKLAGADVAKFQLGHAGPEDKIRYPPMEWARELKDWCDFHDIEFMASIFSEEALELAERIGQERYKIAYMMKNDPLAIKVAHTKKEVFVSGAENGRRGYGLACVPCYPTYPEDIRMPNSFGAAPGEVYGYSSHVHGIEDALMAIARGAQYIEKHVTLDKTEESIRDNAFALSFDEFAEMVRIGRGMARLV